MTRAPDPGLDRPPDEPLGLFGRWFEEAGRFERHDATAMTLATVDGEGRPNARIVLLKHHDADGFVFYTNFCSTKSQELEANPHAALLFWFPVLQRSVRIRGTVVRLPGHESDAYFASRPRDSQIGAWASDQSSPLESREVLAARIVELRERYDGVTVPRPPHWGGWRLVPDRIEFWHEGGARLHDRIVYTLEAAGWNTMRLYP